MLDKILYLAGVTAEKLIEERKRVLENSPAPTHQEFPLVDRVADVAREVLDFSNQKSFWFNLSEPEITSQSNNPNLYWSNTGWYTLVITPVHALVIERFATSGQMGVRDQWKVCECGSIEWITEVDEVCSVCRKERERQAELSHYEVIKDGGRYTLGTRLFDDFIQTDDGFFKAFYWDTREGAQKALDALRNFKGVHFLDTPAAYFVPLLESELDDHDPNLVELYKLFPGAIVKGF